MKISTESIQKKIVKDHLDRKGTIMDNLNGKKGIIQEFKEFALRGNVMDMAIGIVIGAGFATIVNSFVSDIIMPLVGAITSGKDLSSYGWQFGEAAGDVLRYGAFFKSIIDFLIIALSIFITIKILNKAFRRRQEKEDEEEKSPTEAELLMEIRDLLKEQSDKDKVEI